MTSPKFALNGVLSPMRKVGEINDHTDVLRLGFGRGAAAFARHATRWPERLLARLALPGIGAAESCDFVVLRYWSVSQPAPGDAAAAHDGAYTVCLDSIADDDAAPSADGGARGRLHALFEVAPVAGADGVTPMCALTVTIHVEPPARLWPRGAGARTPRELTHLALLVGLDARDAVESERFLSVSLDTDADELNGSGGEMAAASAGQDGIERTPPPIAHEFWAEPDTTSFMVRGPHYLADKVKVPAGPPEFRLVAVDLFEVTSPQFNVCSHPLNRVAQARARGASRWSFVIALHIPGPPFYTFVHYFTPADPDIFQTDTPFVRTSRAFFFGDDDTLRDHTFKLIPKCVDANWVVKRAVGGTPAILGKKLKQTYYRREHYFELDIDIGSDAIAAGVVRLALGYARSIVVDIGYVLEGKTEAQLPESIMGAVRIKNIDMAAAVKLPPAPTTP